MPFWSTARITRRSPFTRERGITTSKRSSAWSNTRSSGATWSQCSPFGQGAHLGNRRRGVVHRKGGRTPGGAFRPIDGLARLIGSLHLQAIAPIGHGQGIEGEEALPPGPGQFDGTTLLGHQADVEREGIPVGIAHPEHEGLGPPAEAALLGPRIPQGGDELLGFQGHPLDADVIRRRGAGDDQARRHDLHPLPHRGQVAVGPMDAHPFHGRSGAATAAGETQAELGEAAGFEVGPFPAAEGRRPGAPAAIRRFGGAAAELEFHPSARRNVRIQVGATPVRQGSSFEDAAFQGSRGGLGVGQQVQLCGIGSHHHQVGTCGKQGRGLARAHIPQHGEGLTIAASCGSRKGEEAGTVARAHQQLVSPEGQGVHVILGALPEGCGHAIAIQPEDRAPGLDAGGRQVAFPGLQAAGGVAVGHAGAGAHEQIAAPLGQGPDFLEAAGEKGFQAIRAIPHHQAAAVGAQVEPPLTIRDHAREGRLLRQFRQLAAGAFPGQQQHGAPLAPRCQGQFTARGAHGPDQPGIDVRERFHVAPGGDPEQLAFATGRHHQILAHPGHGEHDAALHLAQGLHGTAGVVEQSALGARAQEEPAAAIGHGTPDHPFGHLGHAADMGRQSDAAVGPHANALEIRAQPVVEP